MLEARFPNANVSVVRHGYPGASAMLMAACVERMLPTRADAYVVETVDNLLPESAHWEARDAVVSIIMALRARDPHAAVLLLTPFPQSCVVLLRKRLREGGDTLSAAHECLKPTHSLAGMLEEIGRASRAPTVSVRQALAAPLLAHAAARNGSLGPWLDSFMADQVHLEITIYLVSRRVLLMTAGTFSTGAPEPRGAADARAAGSRRCGRRGAGSRRRSVRLPAAARARRAPPALVVGLRRVCAGDERGVRIWR